MLLISYRYHFFTMFFRYEFCGYTESGLTGVHRTCFLQRKKAIAKVNKLANFADIFPVGKRGKRIGLLFTGAEPTFDASPYLEVNNSDKLFPQ